MAPEIQKRHIEGLPVSVVGPVDLGRLIRELEAIENSLTQQHVRKATEAPHLPKLSHAMDQLLSFNKLDLTKQADRKALKYFLATVKAHAPRLHISFSADPSPAFTEKIISWLREQIHPVVLLTIGLQPGIGAGCIVRSTNKYFDFSLSRDFTKNRDLLISVLREAAPAQPATSEASQPAPQGVAA